MKESIKNLKISETTHKILKIYCAVNDLKINDFVDSIIKEKIGKENAKKSNN